MSGGASDKPMRIGVIGVGKISEQYFETLTRLPNLELAAVADINLDRASEVAAEQGVNGTSVDDVLADDSIEAILNLTIPAAHVDVDSRAITAGKHVFAEKPLAVRTADAAGLAELAQSHGVRIGSAPDTVLGTGVQTARAALDGGLIGEPVGASVFWASPGHERWHHNPEFYYQPGGGPLFDMGPYYLTTLATLLGPVVRVSGVAGTSNRERVIESGPRAGAAIPVNVETHVVATLEHESGVASTITMSFETWASRNAQFEIYGTAGTIAVPDPNRFSDAVLAWTRNTEQWAELPVAAGYANAGRGYGLADMARAIRTDRAHRASADLAFHVLEVMEAILEASSTRSVRSVTSRFVRPELVPLDATPESW